MNVRLKGDGVPELHNIVPNPKVKNGARFVAKDWTMEIDPNFLKGDAISQNDFDLLVLDVYHEGRHGYQTFHMARWRQMKLAAGANLGEKFPFEIHPDVARQVTPMKPGDPLESLAAKWHESMYGARSLERNAIYKNMDNAELILEQKKAALRPCPRPPSGSTAGWPRTRWSWPAWSSASTTSSTAASRRRSTPTPSPASRPSGPAPRSTPG